MAWNRLIPAEIFARVSAEGGPFFLSLADSDIRLRYSAERGGYFLPVLAFAMLRLASRVKGLRFLPVFARAMCLHSSGGFTRPLWFFECLARVSGEGDLSLEAARSFSMVSGEGERRFSVLARKDADRFAMRSGESFFPLFASESLFARSVVARVCFLLAEIFARISGVIDFTPFPPGASLVRGAPCSR